MQLTCSHHEFSSRHYMDTLQVRVSCCYNDAINMHASTETQTADTQEIHISMNKRMHALLPGDDDVH